MCRQYYTLFAWCSCEEDAGYTPCTGLRLNNCRGVSIETVHMHCFCNSHATRGFKTQKEIRKEERKIRRQSQDSLGEKASLGRRLYQWYQWKGIWSR
ncbi:hypothetical protein N7539_006805 [Penicillium diatomitis]|uniref:Uncharacterized protein n=1 Tax=Penicillium diatomitis TaxID=2819901 RepID=A0A9W9X1Y6_9EURO|nr:uncharacterized protein N7539_006805 [Penicillium diatomitis]KAJ5480911.1 hypothetical protein N7539_006805 [Penicillium diatomitis]